MKKSAKRQHRRHSHGPKNDGPKATSDRAIYIGIGIVGFFTIMLGWLFTYDISPIAWEIVGIGYLALVAYLINLSTYQIYRGQHVSNLKQSLARIPLRFAGYGNKGGKPLEAAHDHPETRTALLACLVVSVVILAGLALLVIPRMMN